MTALRDGLEEGVTDDVWFDSGMKVPVGRWAYDPCWRCGRQPAKDEVVKLDWMAHTVLCGTCDREDQRGLARALSDASKRSWSAQHDACPCPCHLVVRPGLVPCPRCDQDSR